MRYIMTKRFISACIACILLISLPTNAYEKSWWATADYLLWWTKNASLPVPMVTTSNTTDLGIIGMNSTRVLIGDEAVSFGARSGGRFGVGGWFGCDQSKGIM